MSRLAWRPLFSLCVVLLGPAPAAVAQTIDVTNVEDLYEAVNDPANTGATVVLAPGIYVLSDSGPNGARPNAGRLQLQPDMSLRGVEGDTGAVVISAFNLPAGSFPTNGVPAGPNAAVRMGRGHNALEWLTVKDARFAQANIDTGLQALDPGDTSVRIAHVASSGSTRGLNVLNFGPSTSGQTIEVVVVDSQFFDNTIGLSEGMRFGNFQGARGSTVNVRMSGNAAWGQKQGRLIVNNRAIDSTVRVRSSGNRFYENGAGTIIVGGLSSNDTRADGNTITVEAHGDTFVGNVRQTEFDHGGLVVLGTEDISAAGGGSHNRVHVSLWGCRMAANEVADLVAIGARWTSAGAAGLSLNNRVMVEIRGDGNGTGRWEPLEIVKNSVPEASYDNVAEVIHY
jgi:hypothetical protein